MPASDWESKSERLVRWAATTTDGLIWPPSKLPSDKPFNWKHTAKRNAVLVELSLAADSRDRREWVGVTSTV